MCSQGHIYIAVVDDDESLCRSLSRLLRTAGFQPIAYASAEAFLDDASRPLFDCLVLDIQLSGMSGIELHQLLAATGSRPPVIYITAHDEPAVRKAAHDAGCVAYFSKADSGEAVLQAIRRAAKLETTQT